MIEDRDSLPNEEGCVQLAKAFWASVHADLALDPENASPSMWRHETEAQRSAVRFVTNPDSMLDRWCRMTDANPEDVRSFLRARYPAAFARYGG